MKKLLLSIAFLATSVVSIAQTIPLVQDWALKIGESPLISTPSGTTGNPSVAYNLNTGRIYLADRSVKISILNSDGTAYTVPTLAMNPLWNADKYKFTKVRVADDHVIYAVNMATAADANNSTFAIYRWSSELDMAPTRTEFTVTSRKGDSFSISGTGDNTRLYVGGAGSSIVHVYKVLGGVITPVFDIPITADQARGSISAETNGAIWINSPNIEMRRVNFNPASGLVSSTEVVAASKIESAAANSEYFEDGGRKYLAVSGAIIGGTPSPSNVGLKMRIYDITTVGAPILRSEVEMFPYASATPGPAFPVPNSNTNALADVAVRRNTGGTFTFFHVVSGSGLASYTTSMVLPVGLASFTGSLEKGKSTLAWSTSSEKNNKGFDVLRSTDGKNFSSVGFVASRGQNGNATSTQNYTFVDRTAAAGVNYYQLNQIDFDGNSELSKEMVTVNVGLSNDGITVYPNPATSYVNVSTGGSDYKGFKYEMFDASGKRVLTQKANSGEQEISLSGLTPSVYFLKVSKDNVPQKTVKIIKN